MTPVPFAIGEEFSSKWQVRRLATMRSPNLIGPGYDISPGALGFNQASSTSHGVISKRTHRVHPRRAHPGAHAV